MTFVEEASESRAKFYEAKQALHNIGFSQSVRQTGKVFN